ncbi:MAG TPA: hypothetical protein VJN68_06100 [Burkholderiaceae bacterium]|nr:hypothetical protein [Burkholderiaceae bacterium]
MTITTETNNPLGQKAAGLADHAADSATSAIRSTQNVANEAFDRLSDKVEDARSHAAPLLNRLTTQAEMAARRGADVVRDTSTQLREKALQASDTTVGYIRNEPVKAMLIAAATGAALMALIGLLSRSRRD